MKDIYEVKAALEAAQRERREAASLDVFVDILAKQKAARVSPVLVPTMNVEADASYFYEPVAVEATEEEYERVQRNSRKYLFNLFAFAAVMLIVFIAQAWIA